VGRLEFLRRIFDAKVDAIMEEYGYSDIDEGAYEAITEREEGFVRFFRGDGGVDTWMYWVSGDDVIIKRLRDYEGII